MAAIGHMDEQAPDYEAVLADIASALQRMAVVQVVPDLAAEDSYAQWRDIAGRLTAEEVQLFYQIAVIGRRDLLLAPDPRAGFEMVMLRMLAFAPASGAQPSTAGQTPARQAPEPKPAARPAPSRESSPVARASEAQPAPAAKAAPEVAEERPAASRPAGEWRDPDWGGLVESLGLRGVAHQLALNCVYREREGDVVHLELDQVHAQLVTEQTLARLGEAVAKFYREPLKVRVHVGKPAAETPAQKTERKQNERLADARRSIERDPNVRALQDAFGAEVVDDSIRPTD
jgi:DNA polymerase-3 subunit gamma/tau